MQKCLRCIKLNHICGPGRAAPRAQQGQGEAARQRTIRNARAAERLRKAQLDSLLVLQQPMTGSQASSGSVEPSSSAESLGTRSSEPLTSFSTPSSQQCWPIRPLNNVIPVRARENVFQALTYAPEGWFDSSEATSELHPVSGSHFVEYDGAEDFCATNQNPPSSEYLQPDGTLSQFPSQLSGVNLPIDMSFQPLFSLTTVIPSRIRLPGRFEAHLDRRIGRLWDSYEDFTAAMPGISDIFGRVFCGLLRQSRIMAEEGVRIVDFCFQTRTDFKVVG